MGNLFGKPESPKKDEVLELRKLRTSYIQQLQKYQSSTSADIQSKQLSPETGALIYSKIKEANTWLEKNPNASYLEVSSNQDATNEEITRLLKTDTPKRQIRNIIEVLPPVLQTLYEKDKKLTKEQYKTLLDAQEQLKYWYTKNQAKATPLDFEQERLKIDTKLSETVTDASVLSNLKGSIQYAQNVQTSELLAAIAEYNKQQQKAKDQQVDYENAPELIMSTASATFFGFLLVVLCISAGSVAANMAIGRIPAMRLLYFIYGAIPIFSPFVLLYAIYLRIAKGPVAIYSVLPISIEPATTRLAKLFWQTIYWVPDQDSIKAFKDYEASLKAVVSTAST